MVVFLDDGHVITTICQCKCCMLLSPQESSEPEEDENNDDDNHGENEVSM